jgi:hypothetical protein
VYPLSGLRCITRLCRLNPGPECFLHWPTPPGLGEDGRSDVERLMEQDDDSLPPQAVGACLATRPLPAIAMNQELCSDD